jgi:hypothetical protein
MHPGEGREGVGSKKLHSAKIAPFDTGAHTAFTPVGVSMLIGYSS